MSTNLRLELIYSGTGSAQSEGGDPVTMDVWENRLGMELWLPQGVIKGEDGRTIWVTVEDITGDENA